ncbi:hypothetical protein TNCV_1925151 [Trichonephila clavipes]|nr:hypothetical protein TNCV_1925151 [Trichonephila clavipes]
MWAMGLPPHPLSPQDDLEMDFSLHSDSEGKYGHPLINAAESLPPVIPPDIRVIEENLQHQGKAIAVTSSLRIMFVPVNGQPG